jgi:ubiquinone/menaquinone biosynthesis C-methylase UbiE
MLKGRTIRKHLNAWLQSKFAVLVDQRLAAWKREIFETATGRVLEIGAGTGVNSKYLVQCSDLIVLEPNPILRNQLHSVAQKVIFGTAEQINLPSESVDTVISSLVLCSVHDVERVLIEIHRVLKPGGTYRFIEHIAAPPGTVRRIIQSMLRPLSKCLGDGCRADHEIDCFLFTPKFKIIRLKRFETSVNDPLIRHFVSGVLRKRHDSDTC